MDIDNRFDDNENKIKLVETFTINEVMHRLEEGRDVNSFQAQ